ncbi:response regulator transcription factor [Nitrosophilus kaiyonis]|uniref:response regulator transcription factor n=1 Tax=Nitrosophilus kaiyonis TaxID=2930200 RepID=UPI0024914C8D|nr:response regulator transcription factor [Nitrosophilus kaiyonis]
MEKFLIAVIEDEVDLLELLEYRLEKEGFEVEGFLSAKNVEKFLNEADVDLMIIDRNLPGLEGSEFVKKIRDKGIDVPVIFLSAKDADIDIETGFLRGGDDYITKPFNMNELILRVKAMLKRTKPQKFENTLLFRDIKVDLKSREVFIDNKKVELTKLEFDLLYTLIKNKNVVLTRDYLLEHVWDKNEIHQDKTVNVAIKRLKEKIDPNKDKNYIKAIRGIGYKIC